MSATIATVRVVVVFAVSGRSADRQAQGSWTPDHAGEAPDSGHAIQTVSLHTHTATADQRPPCYTPGQTSLKNKGWSLVRGWWI